ncbi:MAG: peptidase MA family metallohydrolase [Fimbriimonas sp.]
MPEPITPRPFTTSRYGSLGDHTEWRTAIEHYHWDRVAEAHQMANELGLGASGGYGGWYRLIEAEATTRYRSEVRKLADWLELEWIPTGGDEGEDLGQEVLEACDGIATRLGWTHGPLTRVAILSAEVDAPWAIGRYGYMADKYPYDKICVPARVVNSPSELRATVAHEYAHVIVLNGAIGRAPTWLDEAIAMLAEPNPDLQARSAFSDGQADWLGPDELDMAFHAERRDGENSRRVYFAYQQAAWIGRFLVSCCGEARIAELLNGFANNSTWTELKMRATGQHPADEALREVFAMSEREVFAAALEWIR